MTGSWPIGETDHDDTVRNNNRWRNLRDASRSQNGANKPTYKTNKLGVKGVRMKRGKYQANIQVNKKSICLGSFVKIEDAIAAYEAAANDNFGEFARVS